MWVVATYAGWGGWHPFPPDAAVRGEALLFPYFWIIYPVFFVLQVFFIGIWENMQDMQNNPYGATT